MLIKVVAWAAGPNGGGKSSILRSICAGALLATCGLMVPAHEASVPQFDAIILRMMSTDSPVDGKSAFQMVWINCFTTMSLASKSTTASSSSGLRC